MDPVIGAAVAAAAAWISIVVVALLPGAKVPQRPLRVLGGISLALLALAVLGLPVPGSAPLVFLGGGLLGLVLAGKEA